MATPKMKKSHFILIAETIRKLDLTTVSTRFTADEQREEIAKRFANVLADTNPAFNRGMFLEACKSK